MLHSWTGHSFLFSDAARRGFDNCLARQNSAVCCQPKFQRNNRLRHRQKTRACSQRQRQLPWRIRGANFVRVDNRSDTAALSGRRAARRRRYQKSRIHLVSGISQVPSRPVGEAFSYLGPRLSAFISCKHSVLRADRARLRYRCERRYIRLGQQRICARLHARRAAGTAIDAAFGESAGDNQQ